MKNIIEKEVKQNTNIMEKLQKNFPQCFTKDENFNIEKFKELISNEIDIVTDRYSLNWLGKSYSRLLVNLPVETILAEDVEHNNKDENKNSGNIYIQGDNLEVLKHLSNAYHEKIKVIYIDPPYNTGSDSFIYKDNRKFTKEELSEMANISLEEAKNILEFTNSKSNSHSAWLTFMYPRLYIARELLKEDGIIFISIDDNEQAQLKLLCDEIFGESNEIRNISVINNLKGRSDDAFFATCHENLICYGKNKLFTKIIGTKIDEEEIEKEYNKIDDFGVYKLTGLRKTGKQWQRRHRPFMYYPILSKNNNFKEQISIEEYNTIYNKEINSFDDAFLEKLMSDYEKKGFKVHLPITNKGEKGRWRWGYDRFQIEKDKNVELNSENKVSVKTRATLENGDIRSKKTKSVWYKSEYDTGSAGEVLKRLFNKRSSLFDNPKSVQFIIDILCITNVDDEDIILDFFSGSATTAHAAMKYNAENGLKNKYIMVQLEEEITEKNNKEAYDFCLENNLEPIIPSIAQERIKRAATKIKEETNANIDYGFKVFKTVPIHNSSYLKDIKKFDPNDSVIYITNNQSDQELLDLAITWKTYDGIELTKDFKIIDLAGYKGLLAEDSEAGNKLYLMYSNFTTEALTELLRKIHEEPEFIVNKIIINKLNFQSAENKSLQEGIKMTNNKSVSIELEERL